jgi:sugar phosphate isomerase/epimerase
MRIGVRAHDYGKQPVESLLKTIANDGWEAVQLAFPKAVEGVGSCGDVTPRLIGQTKALLNETRLETAVMGVYVEPSFVDENRRKAQARILLDALPQCHALKAGCVGTETTSMEKQPGVARADALKALRKTLEEVLPEAERLGVVLAVEPVHYHALATPELTRELLRDMASPVLKIIFDPANLLRQEDIPKQDALWGRCIEAFGNDIAAVHVKGTAVDFRALFARLRHVDAPILRELAEPQNAAEDIAFLRRLADLRKD